jgi:hypothetical protein
MSTLSGGPNIITDGLVLYLDAANTKSYISGSTTWIDISRSGLNGTLVNGPTFGTSSGGAIVFDGSNDIVFVPFILDTSTNFTVEITAKCNTMTTESSPQNRQTIWSFTADGKLGYEILDLEIWNDGVTSFNGNGTLFTSPLIGAFHPVNANNINTYVLSKSGSIQSWYINSTFRSNISQTYSTSSQYFKLASRGGGTTGTGQQWNGIIYSAKIYNRALSATEITQNYNSTKTRYGL